LSGRKIGRSALPGSYRASRQVKLRKRGTETGQSQTDAARKRRRKEGN
jgi:hypothetical protein